MNKIRAVILLFLGNSGLIFGKSDSLSIQKDKRVVAEKSFSENPADTYSGSEFDYHSLEAESQNLLLRAINGFFKLLDNIFGIKVDPVLYTAIEKIIYALLILFALYFIIKLLFGNSAVLFKNKDIASAPFFAEEEHIENVNLDELIRKAVSEKNYRLAIRYMHLKTLKLLSLKNVISWHFEKTNTDYYREIESPAFKEDFKKASYLYDYIWYGEFDIDENGFQNAQSHFEQFNHKINRYG